MKIALVILHADPRLGGAEVYTSNLAQSLVERGHAVSILAASFASDLPAVRRVPMPYKGWTRTGQYGSFIDGVEKFLADEPHDIVHAMLPIRQCDCYHPHAGMAFEGLERGYLRHGDRLRRTLSRWGSRLDARRRRFAREERRLLSGPRQPIVLCLAEAMRLTAASRFPEANLVRLLYGIRLDRFNPAIQTKSRRAVRESLGITEGECVALMVAHDFTRKGVPEALRAVARISPQRLTLLVVGRDDVGPQLRLARRLGIAGRVHFVGATADVCPLYSAADVLLLLSRVEPCGLVVLEAAAMGLPVVVTRQAGAHEIITPGREGFVIAEPTDITGLADALSQLLDPGLRRRMSAAALQLRPVLSQDRHLEELLRVYETVIRSRQSGHKPES
jgi:UDP-glucose:(heptosyl)LPS alpha-1,3-glucosyltransferase